MIWISAFLSISALAAFLFWCCVRAGALADEEFDGCQIDMGALEGDLTIYVAEQNARVR